LSRQAVPGAPHRLGRNRPRHLPRKNGGGILKMLMRKQHQVWVQAQPAPRGSVIFCFCLHLCTVARCKTSFRPTKPVSRRGTGFAGRPSRAGAWQAVGHPMVMTWGHNMLPPSGPVDTGPDTRRPTKGPPDLSFSGLYSAKCRGGVIRAYRRRSLPVRVQAQPASPARLGLQGQKRKAMEPPKL
jgi:hypothetical protein